MKTVFDLNDQEMRKLKLRYLDQLQSEGCLNEVVFDHPEWDDSEEEYTLEHYDAERLIDMLPDDVIIRQWEGYWFCEEDFAA